MRRRSIAALGLGAALSLGVGLLPTHAPLGPLTMLGPGAAAAGELESFTGCDELLDWYVDTALPQVTAWGLGWGGLPYGGVVRDTALSDRATGAVPTAEAAGSPDAAVGSGDTGTNVQEAGVDEPDFVKTDGRLVVELRGRHLVLTDVTGEPREMSRLTLPPQLRHGELLLSGSRVVVLGQDLGYYGAPTVDVARSVPHGGYGTTHVATVDVTDPTTPELIGEQQYDGGLVSARQYGDTVRLVLGSSTPRLDFVHPNRQRTPREARRENQRIVRTSDLGDWLPAVTTDGERSALLGCTDVRHPDGHSGLGTTMVVTFAATEPSRTEATAVTAGGHLVYSSADRLYLATTDSGWMPRSQLRQPTTEVHAFALDETSTAYVASGEVPGTVRDRWSFNEYDGHLRVATALGRNPWNPRENAVVVLDERGDELVEVGRVGAMGITEQIQSVRWFGAVAVVVTFRQIDPLYTLDLSEPTHPRVLGELKITGFSAYLHPIGDDLLLGLGQDATLRGRSRGAQAAVFDIGDLGEPQRLGTVGFGRFTELLATWDPRAFTYLPDRSAALTTLQDYDTGSLSLVTLRVVPDGSLETSTRRLGGWRVGDVRTLPLTDGTVALVANDEVTKLVV